MGEKRRRFSEEFKREAVRLAWETDRRVTEVAREIDVRPDMLRRWKKSLASKGPGPSEEELDVRRLRQELAKVREERDILKKALAIFSHRRL